MSCGAHALGRGLRLPGRVEQSIQGRTGTRQRGVKCAFALQKLFYLTQLGILWEDDAFEVVLDPGSDEVEKRCLGPVPATCGNTGCRLRPPQPCNNIGTIRSGVLREIPAQPGKHTFTERIYCTCWGCGGQRSSGMELVPAGEGPWRGDTHRRRDYDDVHGGQIGQRINLFATADAEDSPTDQEQRQIAADVGGNAELFCEVELQAEGPLESEHGRDRIR